MTSQDLPLVNLGIGELSECAGDLGKSITRHSLSWRYFLGMLSTGRENISPLDVAGGDVLRCASEVIEGD